MNIPSKPLSKFFLLIYLMVLLTPLHFYSDYFQLNLSLSKLNFTYEFMFVSAIILFLYFVFFRKFLKFDDTSLFIIIYIFILISFELTGFFSGRRFGKMVFQNFIILGLTYFLIKAIIISREEDINELRVYILKYYIILSFILSLSVIIYFSLDYFGISKKNVSFFGNINFMSYLCVLNIVLIAFNEKIFSKKLQPIFYLIFLVTPFYVGNLGPFLILVLLAVIYFTRNIFRFLFFSFLIILSSITYLTLNYHKLEEFSVIYKQMNYVLNSTYFSPEEIINLNNQLTSTYIRHKSNVIALEGFYENPLFGMGVYEIKNNKKWGNLYYTHTWFVLVIASYGLIGSIITTIVIYKIFYLKNKSLYRENLNIIVVLSITLLFVPHIYVWFILPILNLKLKDKYFEKIEI